MDTNVKNDEFEIDIIHLLKVLWQRIWIIVLCMVIIGGLAFSYAMFLVTPKYQSKAMMYVNNSSFSLGGTSFSISASELSAAKSLLDVYVIILQSRTTLEQVIEVADLDYSYEQLQGMVSASSVNGTEVFEITVTSSNPEEAELIVNTIVRVLPDRISDIVDGSSVRLVDHAVLPTHRSSPSYTKYALIGLIVGMILSCGVIILLDVFDTTVRNEDYLYQKYNLPVLAVVPDAQDEGKSSYSYYYKEEHEQTKNAE